MAGNAGGPFTGLYQGASGASDAAAALKPLLPGVSVYQGAPSSAPQLQNQITTPPANSPTGKGGSLAQFGGFLGNLAHETGHMVEGATSWLARNVVEAVTSVPQTGSGIAHGILDRTDLNNINSQGNQLSGRLNTLSTQFKSGQINSKQYKQGLSFLNQEFRNLDRQSTFATSRISLDKNNTYKAAINTASDLVTILTAGFGKAATVGLTVGEGGVSLEPMAAKTATDWLISKTAAPLLEPVSATINKLALDSRAFGALDQITQNVLQRATAEVVANAGETMTAAQIARATAANVALKYPIYYNYMSTTANQIYQELDSHKYDAAIRQLGFNALLLLSGGPIGVALKTAGKGVGLLKDATLGKTSFWDELSKYYGDGTTSGFAKAISEKAAQITDPEARNEFIRNLSAVEATNVNATGGDVTAAVTRLAKGEQAKSLSPLTDITHAQAIEDMVKMAKNFRNINDAAQKLGLGPIAVGRFDVRSKSAIADAITQSEDPLARKQAWEELKNSNPNDALANNANLDRQITDAIANIKDSGELQQYVMDIKAITTIEGFPKSVLADAAKDGYIPIRPRNLQAPFQEGSGKLATTAFDKNSPDFFTRAVQPLPVLGSVGSLLTSIGLSPDASSQRVYQYFNDAVTKNLSNSGFIHALQGEDLQKTADGVIKQLSDFAHGLKVPVTDLRMLTTRHIEKALNVTATEARTVQKALAKSYTDVPLAVRGLGDSAVDWTYRLPVSSPIMRRYLRIQGALRFSFNPFFQYLRVIPKTEMLSAAEGAGYIKSIFQGRAPQIEEIRRGLRAGGLLDEIGHIGNVMGGEAVDFGGATTRNINKHLLPMQERSIAGLIDSQAQRMGMDWKEYISQYPHQAADTIQMIAEYDRKSNFLNSPMARTLNIAIFPFRFDAKVAGIFARNLGKANLLTQVAVINGVMKGHQFLQSPEGQAWYQNNAEAIGLFKYITPIASLNEVFQSLLPGHDHSLGNFGELGGLPFGWIPQLLDSEGLTQFNQPGVDAKTGKPFPKYVPATQRGQVAIAVQDFLSMLFSYPGATVGLPSKGSITRNAALGLTGAKKGHDLILDSGALVPGQQGANIPASHEAQPTGTDTVAPTSTAPDLQAEKAAKDAAAAAKRAAEKAANRHAKKSDFTPIPAPGQSALGVL